MKMTMGVFGTPARRLSLLVLLGMLGGCGRTPVPTPDGREKAARRPVAVAAAADLKYALDETVVEFQKEYPEIEVKVSYGSSGTFHAQLSNKAPFDLYFSADIEYPRRLAEAGLTVPKSEFLYATGQIVVWVRNESKLDVKGRGIEVLNDPTIRKIAIANPKHAPYGRAAEAALKTLGIYDHIQDRLVFGENIAQTAQFVESGAADVGVIALSLAMAPAMREKGRYWIVPLDKYPRLEQGGVILAWAKDRQATEELRAFVVGNQGRAILRKYGFLLPGE